MWTKQNSSQGKLFFLCYSNYFIDSALQDGGSEHLVSEYIEMRRKNVLSGLLREIDIVVYYIVRGCFPFQSVNSWYRSYTPMTLYKGFKTWNRCSESLECNFNISYLYILWTYILRFENPAVSHYSFEINSLKISVASKHCSKSWNPRLGISRKIWF